MINKLQELYREDRCGPINAKIVGREYVNLCFAYVGWLDCLVSGVGEKRWQSDSGIIRIASVLFECAFRI